MKLIALIVCLSVLIGCTTGGFDYNGVTKDSLISLGVARVFDTHNNFVGSCVAVSPDLLMTDYHVVKDTDSPLRIEGVVCDTIYVDPIYDIAVLRLRGHHIRIRAIGWPRWGEPIVSIGYVGSGHTGYPITLPGHITSSNLGGYLGYSGGTGPGMSGGPVFNLSGEIVGLVEGCLKYPGSMLGDYPNLTVDIAVPGPYLINALRAVDPNGPDLGHQPPEPVGPFPEPPPQGV